MTSRSVVLELLRRKWGLDRGLFAYLLYGNVPKAPPYPLSEAMRWSHGNLYLNSLGISEIYHSGGRVWVRDDANRERWTYNPVCGYCFTWKNRKPLEFYFFDIHSHEINPFVEGCQVCIEEIAQNWGTIFFRHVPH